MAEIDEKKGFYTRTKRTLVNICYTFWGSVKSKNFFKLSVKFTHFIYILLSRENEIYNKCVNLQGSLQKVLDLAVPQRKGFHE